MNILETYKNGVKELHKFTDEQPEYHNERCFGNGHRKNCQILKIKFHNKIETLAVLDSTVEMLEGMKKSLQYYGTDIKLEVDISYNDSLEDTIIQIQEQRALIEAL